LPSQPFEDSSNRSPPVSPEPATLPLVTRSGPYSEPVEERSLWEGRTLRAWLPVAVQDVVRAAAPRRIVLFGSGGSRR